MIFVYISLMNRLDVKREAHVRNSTRTLGLGVVATLLISTMSLGGHDEASAASCGSGAASYGGGAGTSGDPYLISTDEQLIRLSATSADWSKHFRQTADLDLNDCDWSPIGNSTTAFSGGYDGGGFLIRGLKLIAPSTDYVGFFGVASGATLTRIGVVDVEFEGKDQVAGIAGQLQASLSYSFSTGSVKGRFYVGGLAGWGRGAIQDSYSKVSVEANPFAANAGPGGLVGWAQSGPIRRTFSTGQVIGPVAYRGGLVGLGSTGGIVFDSFWDVTSSGIGAADSTSDSGGGTGKTTVQLNSIETFNDTAGSTGLTNVWNISSEWAAFDVAANKIWGLCPGASYPYLLWEYDADPCQQAPSDPPAVTSAARAKSGGAPGIFLSVQRADRASASEADIVFGAYAVAAKSPYLLTLQQLNVDAGQRVLARGAVSAGGHLEREVSLPRLSNGSYKLVFVGRGDSGELLTLVNVFTVDDKGRFTSITPEAMQPRIR